MSTYSSLLTNISSIETKIGYNFNNPELLGLAFVHRSFANESKEISEHNERLEFLGDSVLGMLISDYLFQTLPETPEGELSYLRSRLVDSTSCFNYLLKLDISSFLLLGKGERLNDGKGRESILADLFEAIIGAIYLDGGLEAAKRFLFDNFLPQFQQILKTPLHNWKALLQDYCQKHFQKAPMYRVIDESGPDHNKQFIIAVLINDKEIGRGEGSSKKEGQQAAAADAIKHLNITKIEP